MDYPEALRFMAGLRRFGIKLGNDRMVELLRRVGDPHRGYGIAHVTGTKGKGSTTALIAAILRSHGPQQAAALRSGSDESDGSARSDAVRQFRVGGYFSPYVYDVRERVQMNGVMIPEADMARLIGTLAPIVADLSQTPFGQTTEFELKTALGFLYFAERHADYAAIEVGIGGRLDATNVIEPRVSVITNVGLDHTDVLGNTVPEIAFEKAGIIKPGITVVTAADRPDAWDVIKREADARAAPVVRVAGGAGPADGADVTWRDRGETFDVVTPDTQYTGLRLSLVGMHQRTNAACAIAAADVIGRADGFTVSPDAVRTSIASVSLPGRFSILRERPTVVADGAHNAMSARTLAAEVARRGYARLILVLGMLRGHDPRSFLAEIAPAASLVIATEPTWRRAESVQAVADAAREFCTDVRAVTPPHAAALAALEAAKPDDLVLITGSFYTVGDVPPGSL